MTPSISASATPSMIPSASPTPSIAVFPSQIVFPGAPNVKLTPQEQQLFDPVTGIVKNPSQLTPSQVEQLRTLMDEILENLF